MTNMIGDMLKNLSSLIRKWTPDAMRPHHYFEAVALKKAGRRVWAGPFAGMRYVGYSVGSAYIPKLAGSYERDLTEAIEAIIASQPPLIVDVGAAEGYYAVGLARRLPSSRIVAFEAEQEGRAAIVEMARLNDVADRVETLGYCQPEDLRKVLGGEAEAVVIMDVEGYEQVLLDPDAIPELCKAAFLVELHEMFVADIVETIRRRFEQTHDMELIWEQDRTAADFPWSTPLTRVLPGKYAARALSEMRAMRMCWYFARPKVDQAVVNA